VKEREEKAGVNKKEVGLFCVYSFSHLFFLSRFLSFSLFLSLSLSLSFFASVKETKKKCCHSFKGNGFGDNKIATSRRECRRKL